MVFDPQTHSGATMEDATEYQVKYNYYPVWNSTKIDSELTNTPFDGLKLVVKQSTFGVNEDLSDWSVSSTTTLEATLLNPEKHDPYDYEFRFSSTIVDTAVTNVLAPFTIVDVINNEKMKFAITEKTVNGTWDPGDVIFILRGGDTPANIVWEIRFDKPESGGYTPPSNGDLYYLATDKPFAPGDVFSFQTEGAFISREKAQSELNEICVVPNPYVATNVIEPINPLDRSSRGFRPCSSGFGHVRTASVRLQSVSVDSWCRSREDHRDRPRDRNLIESRSRCRSTQCRDPGSRNR